ncbi:MAG: Tad domain-containing protein [Propionibacteriaceae bacterium]|nr:Tad domain-containing protein [Propionibacteriaceae bacterium]
MRRLTERAGRERGAVAVVVAIWTVLLMSFAAIAVDLGAAYSDRQQLQNGADAGALAIAESCQQGVCVDTADKYAKANKLDGQAVGKVVSAGSNTVTVEVTSTHTNWFAGAIGFPTTALSARASAEWGFPSGGNTLPLTFSLPCFFAATGGWDGAGKPLVDTTVVINLKEKTCTFPAHNEVPGGFGWLSGTNCVAKVLAGNWVLTDPGLDTPSSCKDFDWTTLRNKTAVVPIFEEFTGSGSNALYKIKGLAALTITGYCFGSDAGWNLDKCPSDKRIQGEFTSFTDISGTYSIDPAAPHLGMSTVRLNA